MIRKLFHSLADLARAWWSADRVRTSTCDGRLLRLTAGSAIRVHGEPAIVTSRCVGRTADGPYVVYECEGVAGHSSLRLQPIGGRHQVAVQWVTNGKEETLAEGDVDAYPAPSDARGPSPKSFKAAARPSRGG